MKLWKLAALLIYNGSFPVLTHRVTHLLCITVLFFKLLGESCWLFG